MAVSNASPSKAVSVAASTRHEKVRVRHGSQKADVDKQIAPLIREMWKAGIETYQSCQDNPAGWVWIQFESNHELQRFLNIVGDYEPALGSMHDRIRHGYDRLTGPRVGQWRYVVTVDDFAVEEVDTDGGSVQESYAGLPDFRALIAVHFPHYDLVEVLKRMRRFNRSRKRRRTRPTPRKRS